MQYLSMKRFNLIIMLLFIQLVGFAGNRFTMLLNMEDSAFNKVYRLDIETLRRASEEAAKKADEETKHLRPKIPTIKDLIGDSLLYKFNQNYKRFEKLIYERKTKRCTVGNAELYYHYHNVWLQKCKVHSGRNR